MYIRVRLHFAYDAQGNRAKKAVAAGGSGETTYYVREAGGKVIAIYTKACLDRADFTGGGASGCIDPAFDDADHDGIADSADNAPGVFNPTQNDADGDDTADVLDADPDGDGLLGVGDPCPYDPLNSCTGDTDSDGIPDADDPCPTWPGDCWTNPDADNDGDGVANKEDNCPWTANADQADTNANGVGDVCECDDEETGGCPPELAEQYVYGSELDGRVVTVRPARARDMQDHRGDTVFTRVLDKKEYELNDHLGNVRVRFGDVKKSTGTAGTSPYAIDMKGYVNYYPFGMAQPGREVSMSGGRYGYNGKEMDNEWNNAQGVAGNEGTGNSYDYGFRIYDPRVARFLSEDPLTPDYPELTPYQYASNTPIQAIDLDGLEAAKVVDDEAHTTTIKVKVYYVVNNSKPAKITERIPYIPQSGTSADASNAPTVLRDLSPHPPRLTGLPKKSQYAYDHGISDFEAEAIRDNMLRKFDEAGPLYDMEHPMALPGGDASYYRVRLEVELVRIDLSAKNNWQLPDTKGGIILESHHPWLNGQLGLTDGCTSQYGHIRYVDPDCVFHEWIHTATDLMPGSDPSLKPKADEDDDAWHNRRGGALSRESLNGPPNQKNIDEALQSIPEAEP